ELLLGFRVDLAEDEIGIVFRRLLEHGAEHPAGPAPLRPEVDEHNAAGLNGGFEVVLGEGLGGHELFQQFLPGGYSHGRAGTAPAYHSIGGRSPMTKLIRAIVVVVMVGAAFATTAPASAATPTYYLALGDSLAAGVGSTGGVHGYVNDL